MSHGGEEWELAHDGLQDAIRVGAGLVTMQTAGYGKSVSHSIVSVSL